MSAYHDSDEIVNPDGAYVGLPGRVANLLSKCTGREASLFSFLTWSGAWLGRSVYTKLDGRMVYPNIYTMVVGSIESFLPALELVQDLMGGLGEQIKTAGSGVSSRQSLIHLVRDRLVRPEKMPKKPGEMPEYTVIPVDQGERDGRLLLSKVVYRGGPRPSDH